MIIRELTKDELPKCAEVIRRSYETEATAFGITEMNCPNHASFITTEQLLLTTEWGLRFYGAFKDDEMVACFALEKKSDEEYELQYLSVTPDNRNGGIGSKCLEFAKNEVNRMGGTKINAGAVHQSVMVRNWYEKNGFKQTEVHRISQLPFALGIMSCHVEK